MARKKGAARKPVGASGIKIVEDDQDESHDDATNRAELPRATEDPFKQAVVRSTRQKKKADAQSGDNVSVSDIRKAAAFANSVGGLDKSIALLQILKVAKEVQ
jgi:cbb3-type cytochrome oxidase cytochrome c subunit